MCNDAEDDRIAAMYLLIDNYDSFAHNLARYFMCAGITVDIRRNDQVSLDEIDEMNPEAIILSPGPCTPSEAGLCIQIIQAFGTHIPILGICLGHQAIGEAFGTGASKTQHLMHGKASPIHHDNSGIFTNLPNPFDAGRYHSLIIQPDENSPLKITAHTNHGIVMGVQHQTYPTYGVQFHPESILTPQGENLIYNFIDIVRAWNQEKKAA